MKFSSHSSVSYIVMNYLVKRPFSFTQTIPEFNFIAKATTKNNLSTEQTARE